MANAKQRMSQAAYDGLLAELEDLEKNKTIEVAEQLKVARSYGDLSENSEYDEAKNERDKLYSRIAELKALVENAEIVEDTTAADQIGIGSTVTILDVEFDEELTYKIVGSREANPADGKISEDSPVGKALLEKRAGETVIVEMGDSKTELKILKIEHK